MSAISAGLQTPVLPAQLAEQPPKPRLHVKQRLAIQARLGVMRSVPGQGGGGGGGGAGAPLSTRLGRGAGIKRLQTARNGEHQRLAKGSLFSARA